VIVVGGNSGIGLALVDLLKASGIEVISIDIQEDCKRACSEYVKYFKANPTVKEELVILSGKLDKGHSITGLVNLSGTIQYFGSILEASDQDWNDTYNISFQSCLNSCQVLAPLLDKSGGGAIVNMSSGLAFVGQNNYGPYSAAKAAVVSLTKTLAAELGPDIRVNSVAPGAVDTPFIYKKDGSTRFDKQKYESMVSLGAIARPEEIAHVIMFLLSDGASHITGECIHVNGGIN